MKKSTDYKPAGNFALLLLGPPKHGKTNLALAFPKPAVLDCDGNLSRVVGQGVEFLFENPNTDSSGKHQSGDKSWAASCNFLREAIALPDEECQTIIIDGFSIMCNYLVDALVVNSKLTVGGEKVMDQSLWQPFRNKLQQFVMRGRSSNKRFVVTCHETIIQDEKTGAIIAYRPLISGQLKDNLAGLFTDCWRVEAKDIAGKPKYSIRFAPKNFMQIGNSIGIDVPELDVTGKGPRELWSMLSTYMSPVK